jgi:hypothetical protein
VPLVLMVKGVEVLGTASIYELETQQARRLIPPTRKFSEQITFTISAAHKNKLRIATVEMRVSYLKVNCPSLNRNSPSCNSSDKLYVQEFDSMLQCGSDGISIARASIPRWPLLRRADGGKLAASIGYRIH